MSQVWCPRCKQFVDLDDGRCIVCGKVPMGFEPVETYQSPTTRGKVDHVVTLSTADVVGLLGLATSTVTTMAKQGKIPAILTGGIWVYRSKTLEKWEAKGRPSEREAPELYAEARLVT